MTSGEQRRLNDDEPGAATAAPAEEDPVEEQELEPFARISAEEAKKLIDQGAVKLVDVREPNEWERDHLANATLIPLAKLMQSPGALTDDNVIFYCEMGQRSAVACEFAASVGLEHVYNLEGGMTAWRELGYPVEK